MAPAGKKFVLSAAVYLSWPGDLNLVPVGSPSSGTLHVCPTSWSFTTLAGTPPVSTVEGFKTDGNWLKIRATGTGSSSSNFEFTELILEWNVTAFSGTSAMHTMFDGGGWIDGPEIILYQQLASGAPDPGPAVSLEDIVAPCTVGGAPWPVCGTTVADGPGPQLSAFLAADGAGGVFVSYTDSDSLSGPNSDVWLNHIESDGSVAAGWSAAGVAVCTALGNQTSSRVVADGTGGAFVVWQDPRNDPTDFYLDVYLQRITASGAPAPGWPQDGILVHPVIPFTDDQPTGLVADGTGGVYVSWEGLVNRFTGSGAVASGWPANGLSVGGGTTQLLADGAGGVYVCRGTSTEVRLVRITPAGAIAAGWPPSGLVVASGTLGQFACDVAPDGGHVNVAWFQTQGGIQVRVKQVTSSGTSTWASGGAIAQNTSDPKSELTLAHGGMSDDVVVVWREDLPLPAGFRVVAQRLTPAAAVAPGWPAQGWEVIPDGRFLRALPDCDGGTTLAFRSDAIRAIRFTQAGVLAPGWPAGGALLCGGPFSIVIPPGVAAVADGTGGVVTAVVRIQPGTGNPFDRSDIHVQCVRGDGTTAEGYAGPTPVGSNVVVQIGPASVTFAEVTTAGETTLELAETGPAPPSGLQIVPLDPPVWYDVETAAQYTGPVEVCITYNPATVQGPESGLQLLHYDETAMPPGWVDVTTSIDEIANVICGSTPSLSPFIVVEGDPTDASEHLPTAHRLLANVPNPFNPTTRIQYELANSERAQLEILDAAGRHVRTLLNARVEPGRHEVEWNGQDANGRRVASGVYFYRLRAGSFVSTRRMVLLK